MFNNHRIPFSFASAALAISLISASPLANAANFARGQELFEDHCQACHNDFHRPDDRNVKSLSELRKRVEAWSAHAATDWKRDEIDDVLEYINRSFYKF
jgi:mono/diheme cytochrome c family protein